MAATSIASWPVQHIQQNRNTRRRVPTFPLLCFFLRTRCVRRLISDFHVRIVLTRHGLVELGTLNTAAVFSSDSWRTRHYHHQSLNREGRWGTTDDFATIMQNHGRLTTSKIETSDANQENVWCYIPVTFRQIYAG